MPGSEVIIEAPKPNHEIEATKIKIRVAGLAITAGALCFAAVGVAGYEFLFADGINMALRNL